MVMRVASASRYLFYMRKVIKAIDEGFPMLEHPYKDTTSVRLDTSRNIQCTTIAPSYPNASEPCLSDGVAIYFQLSVRDF
jgi:hypothetical protein